jgi:hypothetical protein
MITGSSEGIIGWFKWAHPARDTAAATRELTARFIVEIAQLAVTIAVIATVLRCLYLIRKLWRDIKWTQKACLIGLACIAAGLTYALWFAMNPFAGTLPTALVEHALVITDRQGPADWDFYLQCAVVLVAIPLVAMTSGFIVASEVEQPAARKEQLNELTTLLILTAALVVFFMFMLGATVLWSASLLPQGKDSEGALVQQLALAMSVNFGVFFALLLAALHIPSVWAVARKHCTSGTEAGPLVSPIQYYVQVGTILSPVIAGIPLTKFVSSVFG